MRNEIFWVRLNGNFLDVALLEWCKLFGDAKAAHHWRKVIGDVNRFESGLLQKLGISQAGLEAYITSVREYRDKFVAHLDSELVAIIPKLDIALESAKFLLDYLHSAENDGTYYQGIPANAEQLYNDVLADARRHYSA